MNLIKRYRSTIFGLLLIIVSMVTILSVKTLAESGSASQVIAAELEKANKASNKGDFKTAFAILKPLLESDISNFAVRKNLSSTYKLFGDTLQNNTEKLIACELALFYSSENESAKTALADVFKAMGKDPGDPKDHIKVAIDRIQNNNQPGALVEYVLASEIASNDCADMTPYKRVLGIMLRAESLKNTFDSRWLKRLKITDDNLQPDGLVDFMQHIAQLMLGLGTVFTLICWIPFVNGLKKYSLLILLFSLPMVFIGFNFALGGIVNQVMACETAQLNWDFATGLAVCAAVLGLGCAFTPTIIAIRQRNKIYLIGGLNLLSVLITFVLPMGIALIPFPILLWFACGKKM